MILLTLAAGLGTRAQSGNYTPKALIQVKDKPLVYWSIDSIHPLRTCGLISNEKIFIGVRQSDSESFNFESQIRTYLNEQIGVQELENLTNGPAESAYQIIKALIADGKIDQNEAILINDCDHHYNGNRLLFAAKNLENAKENTVLLCTTAKNPMELSWSFIQEEFGKVKGVVEKPSDHSDSTINFSEGLIGTYGFSSVSSFLHLYEQTLEQSDSTEIFISKVINEGIISNYIEKVDKVFIDNFTSLGTAELIQKAINENSLGGEFKEAGTLLLDLDGTIFKHDSGGGVGEFIYSNAPELVSQGIPNWIQSLKSYGYSIVITSARHESSRNLVKDQLEAFKIPYDELLLGLSGGPRFIFNDTKSSLPCFPTAYAFNYPRDEFPVGSVSSKLTNISNLSIHDEFIGESGERTFLLKDRNKFLVRKISQNSENSRNIISYQYKWFQTVSEFLPLSVPELSTTNVYSDDQLRFFDTEYIPDLVPFGQHLDSLHADEKGKKLDELVNLLNELYIRFYKSGNENFEHFSEVIEEKALKGVIAGFSLLGISQEMPISASVNQKPLKNVWKNVSRVLDNQNLFLQNLIRSEPNILTLIHGDPTLSNVTTNLAGNIFLLDPIGARVLPSFLENPRGLGKAHPVFDFARINLSVEHEYERWANEIVVSSNGPEFDYSLYQVSERQDLHKRLFDYWPEDLKPKSSALTDLVYITTLARIFPYKARSKKKEAFYILGILNDKCLQFIEKYF